MGWGGEAGPGDHKRGLWRNAAGGAPGALHRVGASLGTLALLWVRRGASCERCACEETGRSPYDTFPVSSDVISAVFLCLKFHGATFPDKLSAYSAQFF